MNKQRFPRVKLAYETLLLGCAATAFTASATVAQDSSQPRPTDAPVEAQASFALDEILVRGVARSFVVQDTASALRLNLPAKDIPQSVSILTPDLLELANIRDLGDALSLISGVSYGERNFSQPQYNFRGFDGGVLGSVRTDNYRTNNFFLPDKSLIQQIDVVKGPISANYGEIPPGGTINIITKKPLPQQFVRGKFEVGSWERYRFEADVTGPANESETLLYRVIGTYDNSGSFVDFVKEETLVLGVSTIWEASERLSILAKGFYQQRDGIYDVGGAVFGSDFSIPDVPRSTFYGQPWNTLEGKYANAGVTATYEMSDRINLNAIFDYQFVDRYDLAATVSGTYDADGNANWVRREDREGESHNYNYELNLIGDFDLFGLAHDFYVGAVYYDAYEDDINHERADLGFDFNVFNPIYVDPQLPPGDAPLDNYAEQDFQSKALAAQVYFRLTEQLRFLLAGRYSDDKTETRFFVCEVDPCDTLSGLTDDPVLVQRKAASRLTPTLGLVYAITPEINAYFNWAQSFELQSGLRADGELVAPSEGEQFEFGLKANLFDNKLALSAAVYQITKSNITQSDEDNPGFVIVTGERRSRGFEIDAVGQLLPGWNLIGQYGYVDAEVTEDEDLEGLKPPRVPAHSGSVFTTYELQDGSAEGLGFGVGIKYVGEREANLINRFTQPSYTTVDGQVFYNGFENVELLFSVSNIFDKEYYNVTFDGGPNGVRPGEPRSFRVSAGFVF